MNKKTQSKKPISPFRKTLIGILAGVVVLVLAYFAYYSILLGMNTAKTTASGLEKAIIAAGATKQCETGDGGHGPDNSEPWYQVNLSIAKGEEDTIKLVQQAATNSGYDLVHATTQNRGPLEVADIYLDKWYFDVTSKKSDKNSPVELTVAVNANGLDSACSGKALAIDASHSLIGIDVNIRRQ